MSPAQYHLWHAERLPRSAMYTAYLKPDISGKKTIQGNCIGVFVFRFSTCQRGSRRDREKVQSL